MLTRKETGRECQQRFVFSFDLFHFPLISKRKSKQKGRVGGAPSPPFRPAASCRDLDWAEPGGLPELVHAVTCGRSHLRLAETTVGEGAGLAMKLGDGVPGLPEGLRQATFPPSPDNGARTHPRGGQGHLHYDNCRGR